MIHLNFWRHKLSKTLTALALESVFLELDKSIDVFEPELTDKKKLISLINREKAHLSVTHYEMESATRKSKRYIVGQVLVSLVAIGLGFAGLLTLLAVPLVGAYGLCFVQMTRYLSEAKNHATAAYLGCDRLEMLHRAIDAGDRDADAFIYGFIKYRSTQT